MADTKQNSSLDLSSSGDIDTSLSASSNDLVAVTSSSDLSAPPPPAWAMEDQSNEPETIPSQTEEPSLPEEADTISEPEFSQSESGPIDFSQDIPSPSLNQEETETSQTSLQTDSAIDSGIDSQSMTEANSDFGEALSSLDATSQIATQEPQDLNPVQSNIEPPTTPDLSQNTSSQNELGNFSEVPPPPFASEANQNQQTLTTEADQINNTEGVVPPPSFAPPPPSENMPPIPPSFEGSATGGDTIGTPPPNAAMAGDLRPKGGLKKMIMFVLIALALVSGLAIIALKIVLPMLQGGNSSSESSSNSSSTTANTNTNANTNTPKITLTYWGLWEPSEVLDEVFNSYEQSNPDIQIVYRQQSIQDYRERVQAAIASGEGPDIFRFHNTWLPMLKTDLQPDSNKVINLSQFYPIVSTNVVLGGETFGVPLDFDTLALYYNPAMLERANQEVPETWDELRSVAQAVRVPASGKIQVGGVALGTTNNVDNFSDILGLMLLQNGANPGAPTDRFTEDTLTFYTMFAKDSTNSRVWDETMPASTYAFAMEKVAMIFAPSWRAFEIQDINPSLEFKTAPVPQLPGGKTTWATYWVEGVSRKSKNPTEAWKFLAYLSSDEVLTKLYTAQSNVRMFGEPYPKPSLAETIMTGSVAKAFVDQGTNARSWYLSSRTFDNGINDRIIKYYEDAVNAVNDGQQPAKVLPTLGQGVAQVLQQYNVTTSASQ